MARKAHNEVDIILRYTVRVPSEEIERHGTAVKAVRDALGDLHSLRQGLADDILDFNQLPGSLTVCGVGFEVKR